MHRNCKLELSHKTRRTDRLVATSQEQPDYAILRLQGKTFRLFKFCSWCVTYTTDTMLPRRSLVVRWMAFKRTENLASHASFEAGHASLQASHASLFVRHSHWRAKRQYWRDFLATSMCSCCEMLSRPQMAQRGVTDTLDMKIKLFFP